MAPSSLAPPRPLHPADETPCAGSRSTGAATKWGRLAESDGPPSCAAAAPGLRVAARSKGRKLVFLTSTDIWAFEARERLVFVHAPQGTFDIDLSLGEISSSLGARFLRVHRNWLVSVNMVRELRSEHGSMHIFAGAGVSDEGTPRRGVEVPVARHRMNQVRQQLLADTFGVRPARRNGRTVARLHILGRAQTPNS
jgi:hypothetical protein